MKKLSIIIIISSLVSWGCQKIDEGFISKDVSYAQDPFHVTQGVVSISSALSGDGSTLPLKVKLLEVRNKTTGEIATEFMQEYETTVYTSQITQNDTTFDMVLAKIKRELRPAFQISAVGGQLQFSPETVNIPPGEYTFDVEVSNTAGTVVKNDICTIFIHEADPTPFVTGELATFRKSVDGEGEPIVITEYPGEEITTTYSESETNTISFRFVDKDGDVIDPLKYGFKELKGFYDVQSDYKFSDATPWLKGAPESVTTEKITYTFPLGPFPYSWIDGGKTFGFAFMPTGATLTEFEATNGITAMFLRVYTDSIKITREGAYEITITCESIDV